MANVVIISVLNKQGYVGVSYLQYTYFQNALWLLYAISINVHSLQTQIYCHDASHITDIMLKRYKLFFKITKSVIMEKWHASSYIWGSHGVNYEEC
jgi:hypothetical protein